MNTIMRTSGILLGERRYTVASSKPPALAANESSTYILPSGPTAIDPTSRTWPRKEVDRSKDFAAPLALIRPIVIGP